MTQSIESSGNLKYGQITDVAASTDKMEEPNEHTIYINRDISNYLSKSEPNLMFNYMVNGKIFLEANQDDDYEEFEVYAEYTSLGSDGDDDVSLSSEDMAYDDDADFEYTVEIVPQGVLINTIIYIKDHNWNTVRVLDDTLAKCAVCELFMPLNNIENHMESFGHKSYLNRHEPLRKFDLNIIRKIQNSYHCGHCNELFDIKDIDIHFDSEEHKKCLLISINKATTLSHESKNETFKSDSIENDTKPFSYASIARIPKAIEAPKYISKDLGTKKVKVLFDTWHMLIVTKNNMYHCMACNKSEHIRYKSQHLVTAEHVENIMKCTIVEDFKDHLVRKVSNGDNFYHCGHCNNIKYKMEMENHITIMHTNKKQGKKSLNSLSSHESITDTGTNNQDNKTTSNDKNAPTNDKNAPNNDKNAPTNDKNAPTNDKNAPNDSGTCMHQRDTLAICPFGYKMIISVLSYNTVIKRQCDHYCGLCANALNNNDIAPHTRSLSHIRLLQTTPFIPFYGINLIRKVNECLHCTICNVLVLSGDIYLHNGDPTHRMSLAKHLNVPLDKLPTFTSPRMPVGLQNPFQPNVPQIIPYPPQPLQYAPPMLLNMPQFLPYRPQIIPMANPAQRMHFAPTNLNPSLNLFSPPIINRTPSPFNRPQSEGNSDIGSGPTNKAKPENDKDQNGDKSDIGGSSSKLLAGLGVSSCQENIIAGTMAMLNESLESVEAFDTEQYIYLQLRNMYFKITCSSYNSLVHVGDGSRYCFVCGCHIEKQIKKHVDSKPHMDNIEKCHYIDKYEKHLLRQAHYSYHCSICNVMLTQKEISKHTDWSTHIFELEIALGTGKKTRRKDITSGVRLITIKLAKEQTFPKANTNGKLKILMHTKIVDKQEDMLARNKIINYKNKTLKFSFILWHGIYTFKSGMVTRCIICDMHIDKKEIMVHVALESHKHNLTKKFDEKYFPALIRPVNDLKSNCIFCNVKLITSHIDIHLRGSRHKKNVEKIYKNSETDTYEDCEEDVLLI